MIDARPHTWEEEEKSGSGSEETGSPTARMSGHEINDLVDNVFQLKDAEGKRRFPNLDAVFAASLDDATEASKACGRFLRNVTTCPAETIKFCQDLLATRH